MDESRLVNEELRSPHHVRVEQATPTPEQEERATDPLDLVRRLEHLANLLDRGLLTPVNYSIAKDRILAGKRVGGMTRASSVARNRMPYRHVSSDPRYVGRETVTLSDLRLPRRIDHMWTDMSPLSLRAVHRTEVWN